MPAEIVHPITPDLLGPMYAAAIHAYLHHDAALSAPWRERAVDLDLAWVARDHGRVVGTLRTIDDTLSVPAAPGRDCPLVDADLLSMVSVSPTHRRQGLLTRMLGESLTAAHERGTAVSVLVAAEYAIYGRFGYAPAEFETAFEVDKRRGARIAAAEPVGSLQEVEAVEVSELAPPLYDTEARARAGLIGRDELWWDRELRRFGPERQVVDAPDGPPSRYVVHRGADGAVDGYVQWSVLEDDEQGVDLGRLHVHEALAADPIAYRELWRFLIGIDLVDRLHYAHRPPDDLLPWLLADPRAARVTAVGDAMWLRVLDVPAALSARGYPVEEELVIEVDDPAVGGWAAGRWRLQTGPDGASCRAETGRSPDLTLPQTTLASLYLGGVRGATLARLGRLEEHTPGAADRLDRLFATPLAPWRGTDF